MTQNTIYIRGLGDYPAKHASEIQIGEKIIFNELNIAQVEDIKAHQDYIEFSIRDTCTKDHYFLKKMRYSLVGVIKK